MVLSGRHEVDLTYYRFDVHIVHIFWWREIGQKLRISWLLWIAFCAFIRRPISEMISFHSFPFDPCFLGDPAAAYQLVLRWWTDHATVGCLKLPAIEYNLADSNQHLEGIFVNDRCHREHWNSEIRNGNSRFDVLLQQVLLMCRFNKKVKIKKASIVFCGSSRKMC